MKRIDLVLRELGQLYDFHKELAKFKIRPVRQESATLATDSGEPARSQSNRSE